MKKIMILAVMACMGLAASAQNMSLSVGAETAHLWRGLEVANGLITTGDVSFNAKGFQVGVWGGTGIGLNGSGNNYREFDYHIGYSYKGFSAAIWDICNFTNGAGAKNNFFDYNEKTTGHFIDLQLGYSIGRFGLNWNTIIGGCDLDPVDGKRQFSSYVQAAYTVYKDEHWNVTPSVGGTFKFAGDADTNFYGGTHKAGINDVRLTTTYNLKFKNGYTLPLTGTAMWNPECKKAYWGLSVNLLSL